MHDGIYTDVTTVLTARYLIIWLGKYIILHVVVDVVLRHVFSTASFL